MFDNLFGKSASNSLPASWNSVLSTADVDSAKEASKERPILFFKHSTRCSISSMAYRRLEAGVEELSKNVDVYYLDLIAHRDVSNFIADNLGVTHQSPQVILMDNGVVTYISTHGDINYQSVLEAL
mgnify:CR=1 FL=1